MIYTLLLISAIGGGDYNLTTISYFTRLDHCFEYRELIVEEVGRPIINYQAICVATEEE